jgi:hypothetical protein
VTVRVAELETLFTANIASFEQGATTVETKKKSLESTPATVEVDADTRPATIALEDVRDLLQSVDRTDVDPEIIVRAVDAMADLERLQNELDDVNRTRTEPEILLDADKALDEAAKVYDELRRLNETKIAPEVDPEPIREPLRRSSEAISTFKDEAKANLSETISSFRGDAEDIPQIFQDIFGGVVADLGPAGLIGGALAAAGIGIAVALFQKGAEEAAALKERVIDLANEIRDAGGEISEVDWGEQFRDFGNEIKDVKSWFELWQDASKTNYEVIKGYAEASGADYATLFQGMAGDTNMAKVALEDLNQRIADQEAVVASLRDTNIGYDAVSREQVVTEAEKRNELERIRDELEKASGLTEDAIELENLMAESYRGSAQELADMNEKIREKNDLTRESITADLDFEDALAGLTGTGEGWTATLDKSNQLGRDNQRVLIDATEDLKALGDATLEQTGSQEQANAVLETGRQRLVDAAVAAGYNKDEVDLLVGSILSIPKTSTTDVDVNTADARAAIDTFIAVASSKTITIQARVDADPSYNPASSPYQIRRARGGWIPGAMSDIDNTIAHVASGEYVVNARSAQKHAALLEAVNNDVLPAYANGGWVSAPPPVVNVPAPVVSVAGGVSEAALERFADRIVAGMLAGADARVAVAAARTVRDLRYGGV